MIAKTRQITRLKNVGFNVSSIDDQVGELIRRLQPQTIPANAVQKDLDTNVPADLRQQPRFDAKETKLALGSSPGALGVRSFRRDPANRCYDSSLNNSGRAAMDCPVSRVHGRHPCLSARRLVPVNRRKRSGAPG